MALNLGAVGWLFICGVIITILGSLEIIIINLSEGLGDAIVMSLSGVVFPVGPYIYVLLIPYNLKKEFVQQNNYGAEINNPERNSKVLI